METKPIDLSGYAWQNWRMADCDNPPVILNPAASDHALAAFAWGEVDAVHDMACACAFIDDRDQLQAMLYVMQQRLMVTERALSALCDRTAPMRMG